MIIDNYTLFISLCEKSHLNHVQIFEFGKFLGLSNREIYEFLNKKLIQIEMEF